MVSNGGCFQTFGKLPCEFWEKFLTLQDLYHNHHGSLSPSGRAVPAMQMHYNETRVTLGAEVEEKSSCSAPAPLACQSQGLESHKVRISCSWAYNV